MMTSQEIRKKYLEFFKQRGHAIIPSFSLIPENDPSVLLTTAGMQQFKPYYLTKESPYGNRVASIQKCFRTSSIDEVGDERHLTFFEMLGNFSFKYSSGEGSYFKEEAIKLGYDFIMEEMSLEIDYVSVFGGDEKNNIPRDEESVKIWKNIGIPHEKIKFFGREDNFWGPTGDEGPCGPTTEIYVGGIEIWNIVFNEYYFDGRDYQKLKYQGIDTGMGLERLAMAAQNTPSIFETDLFYPIINFLGNRVSLKEARIIADHLRGAVFLISEGLMPSNVGAGYILRRILRRAITRARDLDILEILKIIIAEYGDFYPELQNNKKTIIEEVKKESDSFQKTLDRGLKEFKNLKEFKLNNVFDIEKSDNKISGKDAFNIYQTYGLPLELFFEELKNEGYKLLDSQKENIFREFSEELEKHQELSRTASSGKFKGGLADVSEQTTKYHTATHLLNAALRKVLGDHVFQKGSNITAQRLRFDFSHPEKMTPEQLKQVEDIVNEQIQKSVPVTMEETTVEEAKKQGAIGVFEAKYGDKVKVYSVDNFSKEICGGPHVESTGVLGRFKIIKEEASSAGVRRIKAVLE